MNYVSIGLDNGLSPVRIIINLTLVNILQRNSNPNTKCIINEKALDVVVGWKGLGLPQTKITLILWKKTSTIVVVNINIGFQ